MSRIGKMPIVLPAGVEVKVDDANIVSVSKGKTTLMQKVDPDLEVVIEDGEMKVNRPTEQKRHKAMHGLYRSLLANMVHGVSEGYVKELELEGVGYRASNTGNLLELALGYSHPVLFYIPDELKLETKMEKGKRPYIRIEGADKQLVGQIAAKIRSFRKPEPYKGKGIRYMGEELRRKAGKTGK